MWFRVSPLVYFVCGMLRTVSVKILIHYKMLVTGCHCLIRQRYLFQNIARSNISSFTKSSILKAKSRRLLKYLQQFLCWMFLPLFYPWVCVMLNSSQIYIFPVFLFILSTSSASFAYFFSLGSSTFRLCSVAWEL